MSNPILRPKDPRFQRPSVTDADGNNRFAEEGELPDTADPAIRQGVFAVGAATNDNPYQPRYEATVRSRGVFLLVLAVGGLAGVSSSLTSVLGWTLGWMFPLLAIVPAMTAWILAYQDLQLMHVGAMDDADKPMTRAALWIGLAAMLAAIGSVITMIWVGLALFPSFL